MNKMRFFVVFSIISILMFVSCEQELDTENSGQGYLSSRGICGNTGTFWRASWGGALQGLPNVPNKIIITDTTMLKELFSVTYSLSLNEHGDDWVRDERFSNFISKYNDTFFESRQLVIFFLTAGGGYTEFKLNGTKYLDAILNIEIDYVQTGMDGITALVEWFAIVETIKVSVDTAVYVNVTDWLGRVNTF